MKSLDKAKYMFKAALKDTFKGGYIMAAILDAATIKNNLLSLISKMAETPERYVKNPGKDFTRNRKLTFETVVKMMLCMGGNTLNEELYDWFEFSADIPSVLAFVQQRNKLLPTALQELFERFNAACYENAFHQGYQLLAIDGTDLRLPTNKNDDLSFMQNEESMKGYNLMHLDAMYDLLRNIYVDVSLQMKKEENEHKAFVKMVDSSTSKNKTIVIADRGYESYNNMAHIQEKGWNYIIRAKDSYGIISRLIIPQNKAEFDLRKEVNLTRRQTRETCALIKHMPENYRFVQTATTFDYLKPREDKFYKIQFRIVRFQISEDVFETVYTNLDSEQFPMSQIKALYNMRWGIETAFRDLKYRAELASLHSKKYESLLQEIYGRVIAYNITSLIAGSMRLAENKKINFSTAINFCRQYLKNRITEIVLYKLLYRHKSPIRENRSFPRFKAQKNSISFSYR